MKNHNIIINKKGTRQMAYDCKSSINKSIFVGKLGKKPETVYTSGGTAYVRISLATNQKMKDSEIITWIPLKFWGKTAEILAQYGDKGKLLYVEAQYTTSEYEKDGKKVYAHEFTVQNFQFLGGKAANGDQTAQHAQTTMDAQPAQTPPGFVPPPDDGDDLPF